MSPFGGQSPNNRLSRFTKVQVGDSGSSLITSAAAATVLPVNNTIGNCIVLFVVIAAAQTVTGITSSMGTFVKLNNQTGNIALGCEAWVLVKSTGASRTVTVTTSAGSAYTASAVEVSGGVIRAVSGGIATGTSTAPALTVTPVTNADMVLVAAGGNIGTGFTAVPASPWVDYAGTGSWWKLAEGLDWVEQVVKANSSVTATWTQLSATWNTWGVDLVA